MGDGGPLSTHCNGILLYIIVYFATTNVYGVNSALNNGTTTNVYDVNSGATTNVYDVNSAYNSSDSL